MTQNITLEDWEAEQIRDPGFRAAVEELEIEYQSERRQMNQSKQTEWGYEDEEASPDDYCGECHRPAVGDHCQQCGLPLCPMCAETGAGFCKDHPNEHFEGYDEDDLQQQIAGQVEQVTSVTGSDIDAAIQDERMIELERQINTLYAEVAGQAERIERLEAATGSIAAIETVKALGRRVEKLEAALEAMPLLYSVAPAPYSVAPVPE